MTLENYRCYRFDIKILIIFSEVKKGINKKTILGNGFYKSISPSLTAGAENVKL